MVEIVRAQRKSPILTPSSIRCLSGLPTINITHGCALGCSYCYIQGYCNYPGPDRVVLFENIPQVLWAELSRKRRLPSRVYFSPSSDAFQYPAQVQEVTFDTMAVLLEAGVEVSFLTKGFVTERFIRLFAGSSRRIFAQVGITSLDRNVWQTVEPRTAPPRERIEFITAFNRIGVTTTARLDPLIPNLTDTDANLIPLLGALRQAGVRRCAASYLFLRPAFAETVAAQIVQLGAGCLMPTQWKYHRFTEGCAGGKMIDRQQRTRRFARLAALGQRFNIEILPCRCKNPELGGPGCQIAGPSPPHSSKAPCHTGQLGKPNGYLFTT